APLNSEVAPLNSEVAPLNLEVALLNSEVAPLNSEVGVQSLGFTFPLVALHNCGVIWQLPFIPPCFKSLKNLQSLLQFIPLFCNVPFISIQSQFFF
ncbi:hypothetical protein, partial [uncultured Nostoc sp.]